MDITQNLPLISFIIACISFIITLFNAFSVDAQRVRLRNLLRSLNGLDWEQLATLLGDTERLKVSLQRLNGRISGMASNTYTLEEEKAKARAGMFTRGTNGDT
jgi:hypothetical protein